MSNQPLLPETGSVALVGAGPGDPDLLTIAALRAIQNADVILHDALVSDGILALAKPGTQLVVVGKRAGRPSVAQAFTNRLMVNHARRGLAVVRLKGGDPMIFGRGGEEAAYLRAENIPVRVIPGITAAVGIAADLQIPLTHRGVARSLRFVTAQCRSKAETASLDWAALADPSTTLAIYMGGSEAAAVAQNLIEAGLAPATPSLAVTNGTRADCRYRFVPLTGLAAAVAELSSDGPILVMIGDALSAAPGWMADNENCHFANGFLNLSPRTLVQSVPRSV